jgi:pilus assembly protein CpaB
MRGIYYIIAAVIVGLVASYSVHRVVTMSQKAPVEPMVKVVVVQADIAEGTVLTGSLAKEVDWPQRLAPPQAAQSMSQVEGRVIRVSLSKGEPVILSKLAPEGTAAGLGGLLHEKMRAYTIKVDDVSGVAGFIHAGDHVDVLVVMSIPRSQEEFSKIVLQDILVLSAGQTWQQTASGEPKPVSNVTLEVTPEQSEVLNLASTQGKIHLTLRNRASKVTPPTPGVGTSSIFNGGISPEKHQGTPPPAKKGAEVIKGVQRQKVEL